MRKFALTSITALVALAIVVAPVAAITGNYVKDFDHPFVGLVVFYDENGDFIWRCSGSLISETKFLTAGHCADTAEGAASARVYFQQDAGAHFESMMVIAAIFCSYKIWTQGRLWIFCIPGAFCLGFRFKI